MDPIVSGPRSSARQPAYDYFYGGGALVYILLCIGRLKMTRTN